MAGSLPLRPYRCSAHTARCSGDGRSGGRSGLSSREPGQLPPAQCHTHRYAQPQVCSVRRVNPRSAVKALQIWIHMARPYADEMTQLQRTFEWAATTDISALSDCVRRSSPFPLRAVGSGGSLTAAHALAGLHQRLACQAATVATPLEVTTQPLAQGAAAWLLSAGGRNVDVLKAARAEIQREPRQLVVLTGADTGPLADLCRNHSYVDLLTFSMPAGRDGFLATNSLLAFVALLTRSFELQYGDSTSWDESAGHVRRTLTSAPTLADWQARTAHLWEADTLIVLHGPSTLVAAVDIESKFTEAALANVQIADYRNRARAPSLARQARSHNRRPCARN